MRVLLIEDDLMIGRGLVTALEAHAMTLDWCMAGEDAIEALQTVAYQIILLDLGLPGMSGLEILKHLRKSNDGTPVIILTARDGLEDRIEGLNAGADDFLVKPFEVGELVARINAVLRRRNGFTNSYIEAGEIAVDLSSHEVTYRGLTHQLPAREFSLMQTLIERPGAIFSRAQIEDRLYAWGNEVESNAVDVLIHSIRKKFDKDIIRNVRGAGWMVVKASR
jgi:DNA-binding response OmpR family regulator